VLVSDRGDLQVVTSQQMGEPDRYRVQFEGIFDRTAAEALRGAELRAEAVEVPGALWVHQLVGSTVVDGVGAEIGVVGAVEANPASDLLVLESGVLIPTRFIVSHDAEGGVIVVDLPEGLLDL